MWRINPIDADVFIGPDPEGGAMLYVTDRDDGGYPIVTAYGKGPRGTSEYDWLEWAKRVGAGYGISWKEIEATMKPSGYSRGRGDASGGIKARTTVRSKSWGYDDYDDF